MPLLDCLLALIAPHDCLVCGAEGSLLCLWCTPDAFPALPSRCYRCKRLTSDFALCDRCKRQTPLRHVWVCTDYDHTAKALLLHYKFGRAQAAATNVAAALDETLPYLPPKTLLVPVPTATSRVRQRGYDQAVLLARQLAQRRHLNCVRAVTHLSQSRQVGANRNQRLAQLKDVFVVTKPGLIKGMEVLVVDDVVTTGATLEAMARVLKQAGAKSVQAVAFAQKQ